MSEVNYESVQEGVSDSFRPEQLGWQTIGRGAYEFGNLVKRYGPEVFQRHNWAPPNFTEVTEQQFAVMNDHLRYPLIATTYRQIMADEHGCRMGYMLEGHLFINSLGKGYMIHFDFHKRRARYFTFMFCVHDYDTRQVRMGVTESICKICGFVRKSESL